MPVEKHLMSGEEVLATCGPFLATSRRLIRYRETGKGEDYRQVAYTQLETVELVKKARHPLMITGTLLSIVSLGLLFYIPVSATILFILGVALVIIGGVGKEAYYQIHIRGLPKEEERLWRVNHPRSGQFIATVKNIIRDELPDF